jgi:hypothetical protein
VFSGALCRSSFCGTMLLLERENKICFYSRNIFTFIQYLIVLVSFVFYLVHYFYTPHKVAKLYTCIR